MPPEKLSEVNQINEIKLRGNFLIGFSENIAGKVRQLGEKVGFRRFPVSESGKAGRVFQLFR